MYVDDTARLSHMLEAAREAVEYSRVYSRADLGSNRMLYHSIKDCLAVFGEAAHKISRNFKDQHPEIDWLTIIRSRNELVHDYFTVDLDILWATVTNDLPQLIAQVERLIEDIPEP